MRRGFLFLLFFSLLAICSAQYTFTKQWDKRFGSYQAEGLIKICKGINAGYLFVGGSMSVLTGGDKTENNKGAEDFWLVKTDENGNKEWDRTYGGASQDWPSGICVAKTFDVGYAIAGYSTSDSSGDKTDSTRGGDDYWLIKIDSGGDKEWDKTFGGHSDDILWGGVEQTPDSGFILGGTSYSTSVGGDKSQPNWGGGGTDYWAVKTDKNGNKLWDKRFGGLGYDFMYAICLTKDSGFIFGGISNSDSSGDKTENARTPGIYDYWIIKVDNAGDKVWDRAYGGMDGNYMEAIVQANDGFLLGGYSYANAGADKTENSKGSTDYWIVKIDESGNKKWDRDFGGGLGEELISISTTLDGGYLLGGSSYSSSSGDKTENNLSMLQTWLVKTDSNGYKQWDKTIFINGTETVANAFQTSDGCYIEGGYTTAGVGGYKTQPSQGYSDYWIMKFCMDTVSGIDDGGQMTDDGWRMQVWSNPFSGDLSIYVQKENLKEASFEITNALGEVVYKREETNLADSYTKVLDLSWLPNGIYFVSVGTVGGRITKRVVKE